MSAASYQVIKQRALLALAHRHWDEFQRLMAAERWGYFDVHQVTTEADLLAALKTPEPFYAIPQQVE